MKFYIELHKDSFGINRIVEVTGSDQGSAEEKATSDNPGWSVVYSIEEDDPPEDEDEIFSDYAWVKKD